MIYSKTTGSQTSKIEPQQPHNPNVSMTSAKSTILTLDFYCWLKLVMHRLFLEQRLSPSVHVSRQQGWITYCWMGMAGMRLDKTIADHDKLGELIVVSEACWLAVSSRWAMQLQGMNSLATWLLLPSKGNLSLSWSGSVYNNIKCFHQDPLWKHSDTVWLSRFRRLYSIVRYLWRES